MNGAWGLEVDVNLAKGLLDREECLVFERIEAKL